MPQLSRRLVLALALALIHSPFAVHPFSLAAASPATPAPEPGLLFYLSADKGTTADYSAAGAPEPTYDSEITTIPDGARGPALSCGDLQRLAWRAPGNIYAQRGTLSFFWRSRYPVGPTEFPVFRVAYADHSSWEMIWLRIDYNGRGFDAFVSDASLSYTRVSAALAPFPAPHEWTHIAFTWDETEGVRLYLNGKLAAEKRLAAPARYDAALDQFGPHSRIISPHNVQSDYNFIRGGDIDEIRIYDHILAGLDIERLAHDPDFSSTHYRYIPPNRDIKRLDAFLHRHGFDDPNNPPPELTAPVTTVRKVEIHDAYDHRRWWWKACDGIRETTWPGVYNRSRLPGRLDYFILPDWDCYSTSGKSITFHMPNEPWNHIEISGAAHGKMEFLTMPDGLNVGYAKNETPPYDDTAATVTPLFKRPQHRERTVHRLAAPISGPNKRIRFTNTMQEQPIGELGVYNVTPGSAEPRLGTKLEYHLADTPSDNVAQDLSMLTAFIKNRHLPGNRNIWVAIPKNEKAVRNLYLPDDEPIWLIQQPIQNIEIQNTWDSLSDTEALDGIAINIPEIDALKTSYPNGLVPFNIQIKDPLWPVRNMLDFSFSIRTDGKKTQRRTLWLDLRDRVLPQGKPLYITVSMGAFGHDFGLTNITIRLVFKPRAAARAEHELDRFTQVRDVYAMLCEAGPRSPKLDLWNRFATDIRDLLRVNPQHKPGLHYAAIVSPALDDLLENNARRQNPDFRLTPPLAPVPENTPAWAARQVELLDHASRFVNWYIDHRQLTDGPAIGEFGGGISDDTDLTNLWPGVALMGVAPEKIAASNRALLDAAHANGMFTNGLNTIQTDELHNCEEGINALGQCLITEPSSPQLLERAMETTRALHGVTGVNAAGHRHIRSNNYGATRIATEPPWNISRDFSYLTLQPAQLLADYTGNPAARRLLLELTDGHLAHRRIRPDGAGAIPSAIIYDTDEDFVSARPYFPWHLYWNAWQWTSDKKYLAPIHDHGLAYMAGINPNALDTLGHRALALAAPGDAKNLPPHFRWQLDGDTAHLEKLYAEQIETCLRTEYINTVGSLWIDRVGVPTVELQRARLGGVALVRNSTFPGHAVSWRFHAPARAQDLAILIPDATGDRFTIIAHNLSDNPVRATITGGPIINPGQWEITQSAGSGGMGDPPMGLEKMPANHGQTARATQTIAFARDADAELAFAPRVTTTITLRKISAGTPCAERPDLGIEPRDITRTMTSARGKSDYFTVTIHNLGSVDSPAATLALVDGSGKVISTAEIPPIPAPLDLYPKTQNVILPVPDNTNLRNARIVIDPDNRLEEITRKNNSVDINLN